MNSYSSSHLEKGGRYDHEIYGNPMDAYMAKTERSLLFEIIGDHFNGSLGAYLDFACGTGRITSELEGFADKSYAIDVSESMVNQAQKKCSRTDFILHDVTKSNPNLPEINVVTTFRFLGNAEKELRTSVLKFIHSALAPDGYLIFNNHRNPHAIQNRLFSITGGKHEMDLTYPAMQNMLTESGFKIAFSIGIGGWIIKHSLMKKKILESSAAGFLETLSRKIIPVSLCPDVIVVAQKI